MLVGWSIAQIFASQIDQEIGFEPEAGDIKPFVFTVYGLSEGLIGVQCHHGDAEAGNAGIA